MWKYLYICTTIYLLSYILLKLRDSTPNRPNFVRFYYNHFAVVIGCILSSLTSVPYVFLHRRETGKIAKSLASRVTRVAGTLNQDIKWYLRNSKVINENQGAVLVGNHQSIFDVIAFLHLINELDNVTAVVKKEIAYMGPVGLAGYLSGLIYLDRKNCTKAREQLENTTQRLIENKVKIMIFPEGTRNTNMEKFLPFKKGAFYMAVAAQVPIIPIVISPYYFIDAKKHIFNKGQIIMQCLGPIPTTGLTTEDIPNLIKLVQEYMIATYKDLTEEVLHNPKWRPQRNDRPILSKI